MHRDEEKLVVSQVSWHILRSGCLTRGIPISTRRNPNVAEDKRTGRTGIIQRFSQLRITPHTPVISATLRRPHGRLLGRLEADAGLLDGSSDPSSGMCRKQQHHVAHGMSCTTVRVSRGSICHGPWRSVARNTTGEDQTMRTTINGVEELREHIVDLIAELEAFRSQAGDQELSPVMLNRMKKHVG